ncbi:hypothetical protein CDV36_004490 [Fusarium kuroshium]|uniref:Uncharacterized protein n=1 Tax=Fusarium kuroshium TaxID=2010991 RepID=A0A3M2SE61_9HYPO|nr:hypothetical protein CDV36_004490 [Fusarium kuroshium]
MRAGLPVGDIVSRMTGIDSLNSWDILVAYDEEVLNRLLETRHASLPPNLTTISSIEVPHASNPSENIKYRDITLGTPSLKLETTSGLVRLLFPLAGQYTEPGKAEERLDDGLFLDVQAKLVNTNGHAGSASPVGIIQTFEGSSESRCDAAIDLSAPLVRIVDKHKTPAFSLADVGTALADHITKVGLQYRLSSVKNDRETTSAGSGVVLKPTRFVMTVVESAGSAPGAVLFWIDVEGIPSKGRMPTESHPLTFCQLAGDRSNTSPIPNGCSASLVLSRDVLTTLFLEPQLKHLGYSGIEFVANEILGEGMEAPKSGISFNARPPKTAAKMDKVDQGTPLAKEQIDSITFDLDSAPAKFFLDKLNSHVILKYTIPGVGYFISDFPMSTSMFSTYTNSRRGRAAFTFTASGSASWRSGEHETLGFLGQIGWLD